MNNKITREEILHTVFNVKNSDNLFLVSIVYKDELSFINHTYAYFENRYDAESWFKFMTRNNTPYYALVCGENRWSDNVLEMVKD